MPTLQIILRIVHILCGVFWAGSAIFLAVFLGPAVRTLGPDGGKVINALLRRRLANVIPVVAILTVLAGLWLYSRNSAGFQPAYMRSAPGMVYGIGALSAIAAVVLGAVVIGPGMVKMGQHWDQPMPSDPAGREAHIAQAKAMGMRVGKATNLVAVLLILTLIMMAIGRYAS